MNRKACLLIFLIFLIACKKSIKNIEEYNQWLNDESNGCIKSKIIGGTEINLKYQPPSYNTLKELSLMNRRTDNIIRDSMIAIQSQTLSFLMTLQPDKNLKEEKRHASVMYEGISNYSEYAQRVATTNFFMDQHVKLYIDGVSQNALMAIVENIYELSDSRKFNIVFASGDKLDRGEEYVFVYEDPFFGMGKVQLRFSGADLKKANEVAVIW